MKAAERNFAAALQEIGRIQSGDATLFEQGGEGAHAHSGEEYRQELRKRSPRGWKIGSDRFQEQRGPASG